MLCLIRGKIVHLHYTKQTNMGENAVHFVNLSVNRPFVTTLTSQPANVIYMFQLTVNAYIHVYGQSCSVFPVFFLKIDFLFSTFFFLGGHGQSGPEFFQRQNPGNKIMLTSTGLVLSVPKLICERITKIYNLWLLLLLLLFISSRPCFAIKLERICMAEIKAESCFTISDCGIAVTH